MGTLNSHINRIDEVSGIVSPVLAHFSKLSLSKEIETQITHAADLAFSDPLLLEKFEMWINEKEDDVFLFHIDRFFEKLREKTFSKEEQNLTAFRDEVETKIKDDVRNRQKKIFSQRIMQLAAERNLLTNKSLGEFLGVSDEQARKFKAGENKPQLATLQDIANRFNVTIEFLIGLTEHRK